MASKLKEIEKEILKLTENDRTELIRYLIKILDEKENDKGTEDEIEKVWMEEANRRYLNYKKGKTTGKPAEQVFKEARQSLKRSR